MMQITRSQKRYNLEALKYFEKKLNEGKTEKQAMTMPLKKNKKGIKHG